MIRSMRSGRREPMPPTPHPSGARPPALPAEALPKHVAVVMDGNGRWAKERGLPRTKGHEQGEYSLFDTIEGAIELGIPYLSAYAFSTENWRRSPDEVRFLMGFNRDVIRRRRDQLVDLGVRVVWSGRAGRLWKSVISELQTAEEMSRGNSTLTLQFCVNYGGQAEIADAAAAIARDVAAGRLRPGEGHREDRREIPLPPRGPRGGPVPAPLRRAAHLQLPALADRVRRAGLPGHALAGLRPPPPLVRLRAVRPAGPPLRRRAAQPGRPDEPESGLRDTSRWVSGPSTATDGGEPT